jgi:multiple sugar transport system permease protein
MNLQLRLDRKRAKKVIPTALMLVLGLTMTLPFFWMLSASMKVESAVFEFPIRWIPQEWRAVENYNEVWSNKYNFALSYWNSIKVTVLATALQVFVSALGAYGFSRIRFPGRDKLFLLYLATVMIPPQVIIVPKFMQLKWMNIYDTHFSIIVMLAFSVYGVFLLRQYMISIPDSLDESAKMDGASHMTIFFRIILPITKPALATLAILKFVWTWNDYQTPLVFLSSRELYTIQLALKRFSSEYGTYYSLVMAAAVSAIIPLFIVFILGQKYITSGITAGSVKG